MCSVVRLPTALKWGKTVNPTYDYARLAIWSLLEMMAGVICACSPGIASLLRRMSPKIFGTIKASKHSGDSYDSTENSGRKSTPKIFAKTTVTLDSYSARPSAQDNVRYAARNIASDARSDELELTPRTDYKRYENYMRYSEDSSPSPRRNM